MVILKELSQKDVTRVVDIHEGELAGFLRELGTSLLRLFYTVSLSQTDTIKTIVATDKNVIVGFVTFAYNTKGLYTRLVRGHKLQFIIQLLNIFITHPWKLIKLFQTSQYTGFSDSNAELLSIAVEKHHQRQGIGKVLFKFVVEEFKRKNIHKFRVSTYAEDDKANTFYNKMGCKFENTFQFRGKNMNYYKYNIS